MELVAPFNTTAYVAEDPTDSSCVAMPTEEKTSTTGPEGRDKVKVPSAFEVVPVEVPLITIEALGTGLPCSSVTVPETVRVCAHASPNSNSMAVTSDRIFLIVISFKYLIQELMKLINSCVHMDR